MAVKALALTHQDLERHRDLAAGMHRLRARVFHDRLDWDVALSGDLEADPYDRGDTTYLLVVSDSGEVIGHVRLLPTTGPTMLANTFPILLDGKALPRDPRVVESSRFCVDKDRIIEPIDRGVRRETFMLLAAMLEWSLAEGKSAIVTVTDVRMERILRRATWPLERIGAPHRIGPTVAVAGVLPVTRPNLERVRSAGRFRGAVLRSCDIASDMTSSRSGRRVAPS